MRSRGGRHRVGGIAAWLKRALRSFLSNPAGQGWTMGYDKDSACSVRCVTNHYLDEPHEAMLHGRRCVNDVGKPWVRLRGLLR